jgi:hypothetical protein
MKPKKKGEEMEKNEERGKCKGEQIEIKFDNAIFHFPALHFLTI